MNDSTTTAANFENEIKELPSGINVLTILTFVGSGFAIIFSFALPWIVKFSLSMMDKAAASGQEFTVKQLEDMAKGRRATELLSANLVPIMSVNVLGAILCVVGAVMMRKLKKDGFWLYTGGEVLPLIAGLILMGTSQFTGIFSVITSFGIPVLFIILYSLQLKHLTK